MERERFPSFEDVNTVCWQNEEFHRVSERASFLFENSWNYNGVGRKKL